MSRFSVVAKQLSDARMQRSNRTVSPSTLCGIEGPDSISTYYYYKPFGAIKCSEGSMHVISLSHSHCVEVAQTFPLRYDNLFQVRTIVNSKDQSASEAERFSVIIEPRLCYPRASANITSGRHERAVTPLCLRRTCCILHPRLEKTRMEAGVAARSCLPLVSPSTWAMWRDHGQHFAAVRRVPFIEAKFS
jgi:hypothetical protein